MLPAIIYLFLMFCYPLYYNVSMSLRHFTVASFLTGVAPFVAFQNYADIFGRRLFSQALVYDRHLHRALNRRPDDDRHAACSVLLAPLPVHNATMRALLLAPWLLPLVVSASVWQWMYAQDYGIINHVLLQLGSFRPGAMARRFDGCTCRRHHHEYLDRNPVLDGSLSQRAAITAEGASRGCGARWGWAAAALLPRDASSAPAPYSDRPHPVCDLHGQGVRLDLRADGGGPADATQTLAIYSYKLSFRQMDFGHGAAVGNVLILISLCFAFFYIRTFRRTLMAETN
jgi:multiple sugar transport system permease protein